MDNLITLSPEQDAFVQRALRSHALLVAGPGTGKTFTLAAAATELVDNGVDGDLMAVLTLTRSMALSLAERIPQGEASTLHSFALRILNATGEAKGRRIADSWEQEVLIRNDLQLGYESNFGEAVSLSDISDFLDQMAQAFREDQREPAEMTPQEQRLLTVLDAQRELFQYRMLDELVWTVLRLLEQGVSLHTRPPAILVDEYQDLTAGELRLLHLLSQRFGTRVVACGDDRQCIFGFRDADALALHRFKDVYEIGDVDVLSRSWRCAGQICRFAEAIAEALPPLPGLTRPRLTPWQADAPPGSIRVAAAPSPIGEARWIIHECHRLVTEEGVYPPDIMIVVANFRAQVSRALQQAAKEQDELPFVLYDPAYADPTARLPATRLLNAGVRLIVDQDDQLAWRTLAWATPGLGDTRLTALLSEGEATYARNLEAVAAKDTVVARVLAAGRGVYEQFAGRERLKTRDIVEFVADAVGVDVPNDDLEQLTDRIGVEASAQEFQTAVFDLSQKVHVAPQDRPDGIPIRTIFGAKGLEADTVFLVNSIPQSFSAGGASADGLRRLYVGVTRAKTRLYITAPRTLRYKALGHATGADFGGIAPLIARAADALGIPIEDTG